MITIDETHDLGLTSWVAEANQPDCDFPIQNLPYCLFMSDDDRPALGVGIGSEIVNLRQLAAHGGFVGLQASLDEAAIAALQSTSMRDLMSLDISHRLAIRRAISELLSAACPRLRDDDRLRTQCLLPQHAARYLLPTTIGDYTDFYASVYHATNVGSMFRPDNPLLPNYKWVPIAYHGRASSIVVSGTEIQRPCGQVSSAPDGPPQLSLTKMLDYELEMGLWISQGNELGSQIPIENAWQHLFGLSLVNDWSARDVQRWEYQPLGPFLAKSFATTVSPWIVTTEALAPFRCPAFARPDEDPAPLPYLQYELDQQQGGFDIVLEVWLSSQTMRAEKMSPVQLSCSNMRDLYWTPAQMIAHHTVNGCNLAAGDLLASGTISGKERAARGCLLELTWDGDFGAPVPGSQRTGLALPDGTQRIFLQDGDEILLQGYCQREGFRRIGLGTCRGEILPSKSI